MQQSGRDPILADGYNVWEYKSHVDRFDDIEPFWSKGRSKGTSNQSRLHAQNKCAKSRRRNALAKASRKKNRKK